MAMEADGRTAASGRGSETEVTGPRIGAQASQGVGSERPSSRRAVRHSTSLSWLSVPLALVTLLSLPSAASAANPIEGKLYGDEVLPPDLKYLLDLKWCKAWVIGCFHCEKRGEKISCRAIASDCSSYTPGYFVCSDFNIGRTCTVWSDGCNTCSRSLFSDKIACTALGCGNYQPKFTCLRHFF
jgi:hypothetical protein